MINTRVWRERSPHTCAQVDSAASCLRIRTKTFYLFIYIFGQTAELCQLIRWPHRVLLALNQHRNTNNPPAGTPCPRVETHYHLSWSLQGQHLEVRLGLQLRSVFSLVMKCGQIHLLFLLSVWFSCTLILLFESLQTSGPESGRLSEYSAENLKRKCCNHGSNAGPWLVDV